MRKQVLVYSILDQLILGKRFGQKHRKTIFRGMPVGLLGTIYAKYFLKYNVELVTQKIHQKYYVRLIGIV